MNKIFAEDVKNEIKNLEPVTPEEWKPIDGFNGWYEVSNRGRIRSYRKQGASTDRREKPKMISLLTSATGYHKINVHKNGDRWQEWVHRLVAEAFIANPENKPFINHKDGNKLNNNVDNLEWCTCRENTIHAFENGLREGKKGEDHALSLLTKKEVIEIREKYEPYKYTRKMLADDYGVSVGCISNIIQRTNWRHI